MSEQFHGTGVALVTPMDQAGNVDYISLDRLISHTLPDVDYVVALGTTGEAATLSVEEKTRLLEHIRSKTGGKPLVCGLGGNNTRAVIESISAMDFTGISAILSVSPYYNKPSQEGIYRHYQAIADASPVPVILYNVPGRTGSNITAETTIRLSQHSNIIGVKEASGDLEQCSRIVKGTDEDFLLISGEDLLTLPLVRAGGKGTISVIANAYPKLFSQLVRDSLSGNLQSAVNVGNNFRFINPLLYEEGNPTGIKTALSLLEICEPWVRLPLAEASDSLRERISKAMERI